MPPPGPWTRSATRSAVDIIKQVFAEQTRPLHVHEVYRLALQKPSQPLGDKAIIDTPSGPVAPRNDHAIRSMRYLKTVVLPELERRKEIQQLRLKLELTQEELNERLAHMSKAQRKVTEDNLKAGLGMFVWRRRAPVPAPKAKPEREVFGKEVGVGEDWSHLNKRRQRAREDSVRRDVRWMKELSAARKQASRDENAQPSPT